MAKRVMSNIKLGIFVLAGIFFLILLLYMIGRNRNLFGDNYVLKARFENVQGLVSGNNVRFAGIQAGTVKKIRILSDTVIEVTMIIDTKMKEVIRKNAVVSIGTDGLVGNKVVNIIPAGVPGMLAEDGDILASKKSIDTEGMIQTLHKTNNDVAEIAEGLKTTVQRLNSSQALWTLLNDNTLPQNLHRSLISVRQATSRADNMMTELQEIVSGIKNGKGSAGALLVDSSFAINLNEAVRTVKTAGHHADSLAIVVNRMVSGMEQDINTGNGSIHALLKDSLIVGKLNASLDQIEKAAEGFNQNMEALKHSFLFRGYFKKLEKQQKNNPPTKTAGY
ncbi:MAG: MCE family protein [Chitinophagaceae bacterium]|nr:MCE family protein [Chitinophagaceae bacterium]